MLVAPEETGQPDTASKSRNVTRWIAAVAVLLLAAGLAAALLSRHGAQTTAPESESVADRAGGGIEDPHAGIVDHHEEPEKTRWVSEVPGIDLADLDERRREIFLAAANTQFCDCGCGYTLAGCRVYDSTCDESGPRVEALLDSVRAGRYRTAEGLRPPPAPPAHPG
jgi:hypothetical protein